MTELEELRAIKKAVWLKNDCKAQYVPFCQAIDSGDYLTAWQTLLGNYWWLEEQGIAIDDLERKAKNVGKAWHINGKLGIECASDETAHAVCRFVAGTAMVNWKLKPFIKTAWSTEFTASGTRMALYCTRLNTPKVISSGRLNHD